LSLRQAAAGRLPVFLAGLYCVAIAVVPVGFAPTAPLPARIATWMCCLALPVGLLSPWRTLALFSGTVGVLGGALGAFAVVLWGGGRVVLAPLGILGFFALSLAWGALSSPAARQGIGQGVATEWLQPRRHVARSQAIFAGALLLLLPLLLLVPLAIRAPAPGAFAYVVALGVVLVLARLATSLLTRLWLPDTPLDPLLRPAPVVALVAVAVGLAWLMARV